MNNSAWGANALFHNTTGSGNIAAGFQAGFNLTSGNNNIDIGNLGVADEANTIRIGTQGTHSATFIAGISNAAMVGSDVVIAANGQLGVVMSSARFKRDIDDMGSRSGGLAKLRPVTFRYKGDPAGTLQYGLVAEEVPRVYPELVTHGSDGKVLTVRYSMLSAMLLNELQRQQRELDEMRQERQQLRSQQGALDELKADNGSLRAALRLVQQRLDAVGPQTALLSHR